MKTRKVGKLVSLILAIVLVATIMIPAVNVLAQPSGTTAADYTGTWTEVGSFDKLNDAIEAANNAPDGSADKTIHLRLTGNITCETPYVYGQDTSNPDYSKMYIQSRTKLPSKYKILEKDWKNIFGNPGLWSDANCQGTNGYGIVRDTAWLISQAGSPFYGMTKADLENGFVVTKAMQEAVGMGSKANKILQDVQDAYDEKIGNEYDEKMLIIEKNTNVVLDLNGKTISAGGGDPYTATPKKQMSVFIVRGTLTVADLSNEKDSNGNPIVGQIRGGTGNVYFAEQTTNEMSTRRRVAVFNQDWSQVDLSKELSWSFRDGRYRVWFESNSVYVHDATESRGGGVYVENGGTFNLEGGKIAENCAWMESGVGIFMSNVFSVVKGGGVFVEAGGTFNMSGGEVSNNAARAFFKNYAGPADKNDILYRAQAFGGGIYLEGTQKDSKGNVIADGAVFNMTGGKIAENAAYAQAGTDNSSESTHSRYADSYGAGIYVDEGATCNIIGTSNYTTSTDISMMKTFPKVVNNSCGGRIKYGPNIANSAVTVKGGGIYNKGTVNLKNALIGANDFSEARQSDGSTAVHIMRDETTKTITYSDGKKATLPGTDTGLALYILDYYEEDSTETYDGGQLGKVQRPKTYITRLDPRFTENLQIATEEVEHGVSGIFGIVTRSDEMEVTSDGAGICVDGNGKLFVGERTWITDNYDFVTNAHKPFTQARNYKRYWATTKHIEDDRVYLTNEANQYGAEYDDPAGGWVYYGTYSKNVNDGYAYSDTTDDVYLPDGAAIYKGGSLFESKIGVNYYNMVNADGAVRRGDYGQAGNRVIVKSSTGLDASIWDHTSSEVKATDIQFFYANDNNKNWEKANYQLPDPQTWLKGAETAYPIDPHQTFGDERVTAISTSNTGINRDSSPYEGYINYDKTYTNYWKYGWKTEGLTTWEDSTYRISDPNWTPDDSKTRLTEFTNSVVNFPQRSHQLTAEMKSMNDSYLKAKYIDYKVVFDNSDFGTTDSPVLRFGNYKNVERQMYVTVDFDEANKHYYGLDSSSSFSLNDHNSTDSFTTTISPFVTNLDKGLTDRNFTFYGANKPTGTIDIAKIVPNYAAYGKSDELNARGTEKIETEDGKLTRPLTSISKTGGIEQTDLYFKGWRYYTSYGDGPETVTLNNSDAETSLGNNLTCRGYYTVKLENLFNPNINSQPCPSLTATWYTREELEDARARVSNVMVQNVIRSDNKVAVRAIAMVGSGYYGYDHAGFVMSTKNATPTVEGGYDFVTRANVYKKIGVTIDGEKQWYDSDVLLGKNYYDMSTNPTYKGSPIYNAQWTFTDDSHKAAFINRLETKNDGYVYAGIIYVDIIVGTYDPDAEGDTLSDKITWDENADGSLKKDTVYYVTPYAIEENATSYYYGQSRAICYADGI